MLASGAIIAVAGLTLVAGPVAGAAPVPPPTPIPPSGSPSPFPTALHTPTPSVQAPRIHAASAILVDRATGQMLYGRHPDAARPIASVTKIMTALLVLQSRPLSHVVRVPASAASEDGSILGLEPGERITVRHLLFALLLQSSNDAADALADDVGGSTEGFVRRMNAEATRRHLGHMHFTSPSGLDDRGRSSARNLAALTRVALRRPTFAEIVATKAYDIPSPHGESRHVQNRNVLLWLYAGATGVKTGFTTAAGWCLVSSAQRGSRSLVAVVLGDTEEDVFDDSAALLNYGFAGFTKLTVTRAAAPLDPVEVGGASVPIAPGTPLVRLVRKDRRHEIVERAIPRPDLVLPVLAGDRVGVVVFRAHGIPLGTVPALATTAVDAPPASPRPSPPPADRPPANADGIRAFLAVLALLLKATIGPFL